ncbi:Ankyrin repeat family protein [Melia azedarach]|uniref:Ankyrin repeat family protein n=1 Tax=Melia azedarach TaxID=155640 RepID=A0ACC1XDY6_MELAZ|nr:Ankyrin repeat family protein [Melia azedarach]
MERRIYEAAVEGSVICLLNLLQEDPLILDRFMAGCYAETPLHIASMLGHLDFVQEILHRKPELAGELDSRKSSALHLATAKGCLDIVKKLVSVNPEMCSVCDRDGKNPLHIAVYKDHVHVLRELVQVKPEAARKLTDRGETILHVCVNYSQLEALKFLVETVSDLDVDSKDEDGNTILHLAVIDKQVEAIKFLTASTTIDVNAVNANGFTGFDISAQSKRDIKDWEIAESLRLAGAISAKHIALPTAEEKRSALMVAASLIATMAFQAGVNPPGGVWQDDNGHNAGSAIMAQNSPYFYNTFFVLNSIGFVASLSIILLIISGLPWFKRKFFTWILMVVMWIAITAMALAYMFCVGLAHLIATGNIPALYGAGVVLLVWIGLMLILLFGHIIRLIRKMIKCFIKLVKRRTGSSGSNGHHDEANGVV